MNPVRDKACTLTCIINSMYVCVSYRGRAAKTPTYSYHARLAQKARRRPLRAYSDF